MEITDIINKEKNNNENIFILRLVIEFLPYISFKKEIRIINPWRVEKIERATILNFTLKNKLICMKMQEIRNIIFGKYKPNSIFPIKFIT